jgi:3-oxoacyl-[acyl-carrier protein] reductase
VLHYNKNKEAAETRVQKLQGLGIKAIAVQADASNVSFGESIVNATLQAFPGRKINIVINNAGDVRFAESIMQSPVEEFDDMFHTNVRGPFLLLQAALPHLASPGGRIINIGSGVARTGTRFANLYSATKGALNSMTLGWAEQLGAQGITVNVVAPGPIDTGYVPPEEHELVQKFRMDQHIKRNGTTTEVANVILFVASSQSSFVTGQVLAVDGGLTYV